MAAPGFEELLETSQSPLKPDGGALLELLGVVHRCGCEGRRWIATWNWSAAWIRAR